MPAFAVKAEVITHGTQAATASGRSFRFSSAISQLIHGKIG
jgi:hypothetical protein